MKLDLINVEIEKKIALFMIEKLKGKIDLYLFDPCLRYKNMKA